MLLKHLVCIYDATFELAGYFLGLFVFPVNYFPNISTVNIRYRVLRT